MNPHGNRAPRRARREGAAAWLAASIDARPLPENPYPRRSRRHAFWQWGVDLARQTFA